jgi:tol-pal system protein YbgF
MSGYRNIAILCAGAVVAGCQTTKPEQEPAYIKATQVEERVNALERQSQGMLDLQRQIEGLQADVRTLRGDLDQTQHDAQGNRVQSRELYGDLDKRMTALETRTASAQVSAPGTPVTTGGDRDAYQAALDRLKSRDYPGAEKALTDMIARYPDSTLADNAQYWLGETYYVEKRYDSALAAFQRVVKDHPDSRKVPDALLKAGYSVYELKRYKEARDYLQRVVSQYPDSNAATEARERLRRMDAESRGEG